MYVFQNDTPAICFYTCQHIVPQRLISSPLHTTVSSETIVPVNLSNSCPSHPRLAPLNPDRQTLACLARARARVLFTFPFPTSCPLNQLACMLHSICTAAGKTAKRPGGYLKNRFIFSTI